MQQKQKQRGVKTINHVHVQTYSQKTINDLETRVRVVQQSMRKKSTVFGFMRIKNN
jgi:hypothetical protein